MRKARDTIHNQSFPFHSEAYSMWACNSGMHDSMDEELESCFKGWAWCYCTAHGHSVAGQQGLFSAAGIPTSASIDTCYIVYLCGVF